MQFVIANTFQESLAKLQGQEQLAAKLAAMELQMNPAHPSLKMHRLEKMKDKSFWSARANDDIRIIVHRTENSCLLCYADHHDAAYAWAERRKLSVHPTTGAAQMVVMRETVREIVVRNYVPETSALTSRSLPLLTNASDDELLGYGVPEEWLSAVRQATEDTVLDLIGNLPEEAGEAILSLATGVRPIAAVATRPYREAPSATMEQVAFAHPDAQRRFRTVNNRDELERALDTPWEKLAVVFHAAADIASLATDATVLGTLYAAKGAIVVGEYVSDTCSKARVEIDAKIGKLADFFARKNREFDKARASRNGGT